MAFLIIITKWNQAVKVSNIFLTRNARVIVIYRSYMKGCYQAGFELQLSWLANDYLGTELLVIHREKARSEKSFWFTIEEFPWIMLQLLIVVAVVTKDEHCVAWLVSKCLISKIDGVAIMLLLIISHVLTNHRLSADTPTLLHTCKLVTLNCPQRMNVWMWKDWSVAKCEPSPLLSRVYCIWPHS